MVVAAVVVGIVGGVAVGDAVVGVGGGAAAAAAMAVDACLSRNSS